MIGMFFKFTLSFVICFIILSFNIDRKPLFYHISELTGPLGAEVQDSIRKSVKRSYKKSKKLGEGMFSDTTPSIEDLIQSKRSASKYKHEEEMVLEELRHDEIKRLDDIIKNN